MTAKEKISLLQSLRSHTSSSVSLFYETLEKCSLLKYNYNDYMSTAPINCNQELLRLPNADLNLCCALLTMLLREDHFSNGSFETRLKNGDVYPIIDRIVFLLSNQQNTSLHSFSEKALASLNGFYVYALADPRNNKVFYVGKGTGNRVFAHELETKNTNSSEKKKQKIIKEILQSGLSVKKVIVNWGLTEKEAFIAEASLINILNFLPNFSLSNEVSGHHTHGCMTVEDFEMLYGAVPLEREDIKHSILVIKINKLYHQGISSEELYNITRGFWAASLKSINARKVKYVWAVYNGLIVAVYQPDEWHYGYEMIDIPQKELLKPDDYERLKNRVYFICKNYESLDHEGRFYLHKSIAHLQNILSAQNPITYISPKD